MCSRSCSGSVATCAASRWNDCLSPTSMHPWWRRSSITLRNDRHASIRTQNHRLAALHAFFRYVQSEVPERLLQSQQILAIPLRRHPRRSVGYLSKELLAQILAQPDLRTPSGRRDAVLLSVLYDTGARVQELIDLNAGDVRLDAPPQVRLMGKGRKMRAVPLMDATVDILRDHRRENGLDRPEHADQPLFQNRQGGRLTRTGVRYLLQKYVAGSTARSSRLHAAGEPSQLAPHQGNASAAEWRPARNHRRAALAGQRGGRSRGRRGALPRPRPRVGDRRQHRALDPGLERARGAVRPARAHRGAAARPAGGRRARRSARAGPRA